MSEEQKIGPVLLPYQLWVEEALLDVALRALEAASPDALPGDHHYFLTFRTDHPRTEVPGHVKARYREEMTVILQHQFWGLKVDREARTVSVGLSFGKVPSTITFAYEALVAFADPHAGIALRFQEMRAAEAARLAAEPIPAPATGAEAAETVGGAAPESVVSLDAFRKRRS